VQRNGRNAVVNVKPSVQTEYLKDYKASREGTGRYRVNSLDLPTGCSFDNLININIDDVAVSRHAVQMEMQHPKKFLALIPRAYNLVDRQKSSVSI